MRPFGYNPAMRVESPAHHPVIADPAALSARVLAFMRAPEPVDQLFRLQDLADLGAPDRVRSALRTLQRAHLVGSPAPDLWFPLVRQVRDHAADRFVPPAYMRHMAVRLLARMGVREVRSMADRETAKAAQWLEEHGGQAHPETDTPDSAPPVGVWGVAEDRVIGVDRPVALHLRWANREYFTEYKDVFLDRPLGDVATPFSVLDAAAFRTAAHAAQINPIRLEKDLKVNHVLHLLQDWRPPGCDTALTGGTALAKGYRAITRFSEDVDLHIYPEEPGPVSLATKQAVWDSFLAYLETRVVPVVDGGAVDLRETRFLFGRDGQGRFTQHASLAYASRFPEDLGDADRPLTAPDQRHADRPWAVRFDLTFRPPHERPPLRTQPLLALPNVLEFPEAVVADAWPCVAPEHIAIGKLDNLHGFLHGRRISGNLRGGPPVSVMRHVQDLAELRILLLVPALADTIARAMPAAKRSELRTGLAAWEADSEKRGCFAEYSKLMRPHQDPAMVPIFDQTLRDLQDMLSAWSVVDGREPAPVDRGRRGGQF